MSSLLINVRPCDGPIGHRSRREMYLGHGRAPQHPMKMGYRPMRADSIASCLKNAALSGSPDAMNMAWIVIFTSTMFRALDFKPTHQLVER
jgi:hypothetical protein